MTKYQSMTSQPQNEEEYDYGGIKAGTSIKIFNTRTFSTVFTISATYPRASIVVCSSALFASGDVSPVITSKLNYRLRPQM